jgi:hypothetical protein
MPKSWFHEADFNEGFMKIRLLCLLAVISLAMACKSANSEWGRPAITDEASKSPSQLVAVVLGVLENNGRSGSLEYRGVCTTSGGIADSFKVAAPQHDAPPLEALRQAFESEPALRITEDASALIRVVGGDVQADLLNLRIHQVVFRGEREPWDAMYKFLALPEVRAYMQAHHMAFIMTPVGLVPPPSGRVLNGTPEDLTLSQALDRIAQAFPGVWVYGECATGQGQRRVYMTFHEFSAQAGGRPSIPKTKEPVTGVVGGADVNR